MKPTSRRFAGRRLFATLPRIWRRGAAVALVILVPACSQQKGTNWSSIQPPKRQPQPVSDLPPAELGTGKNILVIVDESGSMENSDPNDLRWEGARLMLAMADEEDNFAAIGFASDGQTVCPLTRVGGRDRRAVIFKRLTTDTGVALAENSGRWPNSKKKDWRDYTHFASAFEKTGAELRKVPPDSPATLVMLTDGDNNYARTDATTVRRAFDDSIGMETPLYGMALRTEGDSPLLRSLTATSGGSYFPIADAEGLLEGYVKASEMLQDLVVLRDSRSGGVHLNPGTRSFLLIVLRGTNQARIEELRVGEAVIDLSRNPHLHHFTAEHFEVVNVRNPSEVASSPKWTWKTSSQASIAHVAKRPGWDFRPVEPFGKLPWGAPITVGAELKSSVVFSDGFEESLRATCTITPSGEPERPPMDMHILRFGNSKLDLRYEHETGKPVFEKEGEWRIHLVMYIRDDAEQTWILDRNWLVSIDRRPEPEPTPPQPPCDVDYAAAGTEDLGSAVAGCFIPEWSGPLVKGDCDPSVSVSLPTVVTLRQRGGGAGALEAKIAPTTLTLGEATADSAVTILVNRLPLSAAAGVYRGEMQLSLSPNSGLVRLPTEALHFVAEVTRGFCRLVRQAGFGAIPLGGKPATTTWEVENVSCHSLRLKVSFGNFTNELGVTLPPECLQVDRPALELTSGTSGHFEFSVWSSRDFPPGPFKTQVKLEVYGGKEDSLLQSVSSDLKLVFRNR